MSLELTADLLNEPLFFSSNRVWRCYVGGALLDRFTAESRGGDGNFPEDWLASVTRADNGNWQQSPDEGLSVLRGSGLPFHEVINRFRVEALGEGNGSTGVLCKFLDSAVRLPVQCHPDREFSLRHYNSPYGKTESWLILDTREVNGEKPYLLLGFKPGTTEDEFRRAVLAQDIPAMCGCLNKVTPRPGEVYFIPGRLPHAIGPGLLLLEVQEPTDLVIQPEQRVGNITLSECAMWGGLDRETAFSCFDYSTRPLDVLLAELRLSPTAVCNYSDARLESLISPQHTECFQVDRLIVDSSVQIPCLGAWHLAIVTSGAGTVQVGDTHPIRQGETMFISNRIHQLSYRNTGAKPLVIHMVSRR